MTDPGFRAALAAHGYKSDPETGEIIELAGFVGAFSVRARQIELNIDGFEPSGVPSIPVRNRVRRCAGPGTGAPGPRPDRTSWSRPPGKS
jgi:hypothetical protein